MKKGYNFLRLASKSGEQPSFWKLITSCGLHQWMLHNVKRLSNVLREIPQDGPDLKSIPPQGRSRGSDLPWWMPMSNYFLIWILNAEAYTTHLRHCLDASFQGGMQDVVGTLSTRHTTLDSQQQAYHTGQNVQRKCRHTYERRTAQ